MQGDFSRTTFDAADSYRAVLLQQGRVLLDADWNEQAEITAHHDEVRTRDVVGRSGGPAPAAGATGPAAAGPFAVVAAGGSAPAGTAWADLRVSPGTYYVDGILCESTPPAAPAVGWPLTDQPHLPAIGAADPGLAEPAGTAPGDRYALYLDVWTHHVTADEDPALIEPALGGPDTTTRARTVWQVRAIRLKNGEQCSDLHVPGWSARTPRRMIAGLRPPDAGADPCLITGSGGYQRLENQLYRVQVHDTVSGGTFVWSRDNGSVVAALLTLAPGSGAGSATLGLDRVGRDEELSLREQQLVEVTSRDRELRGLPGFLARTGAPTGLTLPVTWLGAAPASLAALGSSPVVRRWDGGPLPVRTTATDLEAGITVRFPAGGEVRTGDFWTIPARTVRLAYGLTQLSGTIEWPPGDRGPTDQPPAGIVHHVAPLAILRRAASGWDLESDCRLLFPPLTGLVTVDLVGGDGQEAMPGDPLAEPVRVVVRNGSSPVVGARLSATTVNGHLSVGGVPDLTSPATLPKPPGTLQTLVTGADGVAAVRWLLDPAGPAAQTLTIRRLDDHGNPVDVPVVVTARLSVAAQVRWTPVCAGFAGTRTVQDALARLATTAELRLLGGDGQTVAAPGSVVPQPVRVVVDSPCGPVAGVTVVARASAGASGAGLVVAAVDGQPTPATLDNTGARKDAEVPTDDTGVAAFWWQPGFGNDRSGTLELSVAGASDPAIRVAAQLDPPGARRPGVHITRLTFATGVLFRNDSDVAVDDLVSGIHAELDGPVRQDSVQNKPVVRVELDLPWPLSGEDHQIWADFPVGYRTVVLDATVNADGALLVWWPSERTREWLVERMWTALGKARWDDPILGRLIIDGWAIVAEKDPAMHLNGHANARLQGGRTLLELPTDDEVTGGRFVQWFRLSRNKARAVDVPDVGRRTPAVARRLIEAAGLVVADEVDEPGLALRRGLVLRTDPPAGSPVDPGTGVVVVVSDGRG
ncbi:DUF6519 domain-containing protein [Micromonospora sp. NPDC093277]|uniref:DUF6519 domain-containing protein n=1 Tax=Micromonospora sp. NPDC093277 TaxID=3364291 RepID=UPI0037FBCBF5